MSGGASRYLLAGGVSCLLLAFGGLMQPTKRLILNTTASAPLGFYWLAGQEPDVGDLALVRPPPPLARWMARRGYLPMNVPLIKRVAAVTGQIVCGDHGRVLIDGQTVAKVLLHDRLHRPLKGISGCRRVGEGEVFLLNSDAPHSLDGRYFGPLPRQAVVGRLHPIWTWGR